MKKNVFIGGINLNNKPLGGEEAKNQQIVQYIKKKKLAYHIIDTHNWKKRILVLMILIFKTVIIKKNISIFLSLSYLSTLKLLKVFNFLGIFKNNKVIYIVIGGQFHNWLSKNKQYVPLFNKLAVIYPESLQMVEQLKAIGINKVEQLPNMKEVPKLNIKRDYEIINFVFLSRITPTKGSDLILEAVKKLNDEGLGNKFKVTFYGNFHDVEDSAYKSFFLEAITKIDNIQYKGFLQLQNSINYEILAQNNVMLFPTFWKGEGYPGVLVDSYIAHLPIIASDWNHNSEIVQTDINGVLIEPKSSSALKNAMKKIIFNLEYLKIIENGAKESVNKYNIDYLLTNIIV